MRSVASVLACAFVFARTTIGFELGRHQPPRSQGMIILGATTHHHHHHEHHPDDGSFWMGDAAICDRRSALPVLLGIASGAVVGLGPNLSSPSWARAPGSTDVREAIRQIRDASVDLRKLQQNFDKYAVVNDEGRAVTDATVVARRILGGVAPLAGDSAIAVARATPLYRVDSAFNLIRKACLEGGEGNDWTENLDLLAFEELSERIQFQLQKADGDFYSVQFASKGTKQISGIYKEARAQVDQGVVDFDKMLALLAEAGAPGL